MSKKSLIAVLAPGIVAVASSCTIRDITEIPVGTVEVQPSSVILLEGQTQRLTAKVRDGAGKELPSGAVTWSSDASKVFSIDDVGSGEALAAGTTTVWASLDGVRGSATISVEPGPTLVVAGPTLQFYLGVGGPALDPIGLGITNGGGGSVGGISAAAQYPEGGRPGWLSLALTGTVAPSTLYVSVPRGLLGEGVYDATLVLASGDAVNSPVTLPVQAVVTQTQPIIGLSPRSLEFQFDGTPGPPDPQTVQVNNVGGGVLSGLQVVPLYVGVGGWLSTSLTGTAGLSTGIVVQAWDAYGNPLTSGGETVTVTVSGANNAGALAVTDQGDGSYTAGYTPTAAGTDNVAITINGTSIGGSPFASAVEVGAVSPASSTATVPGGTVGIPITIVVQARDAYGNPLEVGGEAVVMTVTGKNPTGPITATDEGDGTYTASYTPLEKGLDKVDITMNGTPISGSPFNCKVDIGAVSLGLFEP